MGGPGGCWGLQDDSVGTTDVGPRTPGGRASPGLHGREGASTLGTLNISLWAGLLGDTSQCFLLLLTAGGCSIHFYFGSPASDLQGGAAGGWLGGGPGTGLPVAQFFLEGSQPIPLFHPCVLWLPVGPPRSEPESVPLKSPPDAPDHPRNLCGIHTLLFSPTQRRTPGRRQRVPGRLPVNAPGGSSTRPCPILPGSRTGCPHPQLLHEYPSPPVRA